MRIHYFDNFRAISILIIILGHCYHPWIRDEYWEIFLANIITGGTALFVFISGFFLHAVFFQNFNYKKFIRKKTIGVAVPYVVLSVMFMALNWMIAGDLPQHSSFADLTTSQIALANILTGRHLVAYWYVPFILIIFLLTPVFIIFIKVPFRIQILITTTLFFLSSIFWRPTDGLDPIHSVLYFTPFYLLGMIYSLKKQMFDGFMTTNSFSIPALLIGILLVMSAIGQAGNLTKSNPFHFEGFDLMILQKIFLIFCFLQILRKYFDLEIPFLKFIANYSFPLFFIHGWILSLLFFINVMPLFHDGFLGSIELFSIVLSMSLCGAVLVRKILGRRSKYIIGA